MRIFLNYALDIHVAADGIVTWNLRRMEPGNAMLVGDGVSASTVTAPDSIGAGLADSVRFALEALK